MRGGRPTTIPDWISHLDERLRLLEHRRDVTVGNWVLEQQDDGSLVARHAPTGSVTVVAPPAS